MQRPDTFRVIRRQAMGFTAAPLLLVAVAYLLSRGHTDPVPAASPVMTGVWLALAIAGLVCSRVFRDFTLSRARSEKATPESVAATAFFLGMAPLEAISLLGFQSFCIGGSWLVYGIMMIFWALGMPALFPTRRNWESWTAKAAETLGREPSALGPEADDHPAVSLGAGIASPAVDALWRQTRVVSFALPAIVPLLVDVARVIRRDEARVGLSPAMQQVLVGFGVVALAVVLVAPAILVRAQRPVIASLSPAMRPRTASALLIARYAVSEIPVLLGFVIFFMGASWLVFAAFIALTLVSFAAYFPRREVFDELAGEQMAASAVPPPL